MPALFGLLQFATAGATALHTFLHVPGAKLAARDWKPWRPQVVVLLLQTFALLQWLVPSRPLAPIQAAATAPLCAWLLTIVLDQALGKSLDHAALVQPQLVEVTLGVVAIMFGTFKVAKPAGLAIAMVAGSLVYHQWGVLATPTSIMKAFDARKTRAALKEAGKKDTWHRSLRILLLVYQSCRAVHAAVCCLIGTGVLPGSDSHLGSWAYTLWAFSSLIALIALPQALLAHLSSTEYLFAVIKTHFEGRRAGQLDASAVNVGYCKELQLLLDDDAVDSKRACYGCEDHSATVALNAHYGKAVMESLLATHLSGISEGTEIMNTSDLLGTSRNLDVSAFGLSFDVSRVEEEGGRKSLQLIRKVAVVTVAAATQTETALELAPVTAPVPQPQQAQPAWPQPVSAQPPTQPPEANSDYNSNSNSWRVMVEAVRAHGSHIAHDLKNPLNGVLALTQTVAQGTFGAVPATACEQLNVVRACAYQLLNMVNMTRDLMKGLHMGDMGLGADLCGVTDHVTEAITRLRPMVGNRLTITNNIPETTRVVCDNERLYQVIHVVLANALKYTRRGGIELSVEEYGAGGPYVVVRCSDTGTGLSDTQLDKFNSPFTGTVDEQLGLGLLMVKRIMALWGGQLKVTNKTGGAKGAVVDLVFRKDKTAAPLQQAVTVAADCADHSQFQSQVGTPRTGPQGPPSTGLSMTMQHPSAGSGGAAHNSTRHCDASEPGPAATATPAPVQPSATDDKRIQADVHAADSHNHSATAESDTLGAPHSADASEVTRLTSKSLEQWTETNGKQKQLEAQTGARDSHSTLRKAGTGIYAGAAILVVEDDVTNNQILATLLENAGYDVVSAMDGKDALQAFVSHETPIRLVLLDMTLPDMMGDEICSKIIGLSPGIPPPIIIISGDSGIEAVVKGLAAGALDYITKPFHPNDVLARVETHLRVYMGEFQAIQEEAERNMQLLSQILPPHILSALRGGQRVMVETFSDVYVLHVEVVGLSALIAHGDGVDCITTLNQLYCIFDQLMDKHAVHKVECTGNLYCAAVGHEPEDGKRSSLAQLSDIVACAQDMLQITRDMSYPESLGKMEIRAGLHAGPASAGVLGVKFPKYSFFGAAQRLSVALTQTALPMSVHVSEVIYKRSQKLGAAQDAFVPFTMASFSGMGIIHTYLSNSGWLDMSALSTINIHEYLSYLSRNNKEVDTLQIMQSIVPGSHSGTHLSSPRGSLIPHSHYPLSHMGTRTSMDPIPMSPRAGIHTGSVLSSTDFYNAPSPLKSNNPYMFDLQNESVRTSGTRSTARSHSSRDRTPLDNILGMGPHAPLPVRTPPEFPCSPSDGSQEGKALRHSFDALPTIDLAEDMFPQSPKSQRLGSTASPRSMVSPRSVASPGQHGPSVVHAQAVDASPKVPTALPGSPCSPSAVSGGASDTISRTAPVVTPAQPRQTPGSPPSSGEGAGGSKRRQTRMEMARNSDASTAALDRVPTFGWDSVGAPTVPARASSKHSARLSFAPLPEGGSKASQGRDKDDDSDTSTSPPTASWLDWGEPEEELLEQLGMTNKPPGRSKSFGAMPRTHGGSQSISGGTRMVWDNKLFSTGGVKPHRVSSGNWSGLPAPRVSSGTWGDLPPPRISSGSLQTSSTGGGQLARVYRSKAFGAAAARSLLRNEQLATTIEDPKSPDVSLAGLSPSLGSQATSLGAPDDIKQATVQAGGTAVTQHMNPAFEEDEG